MLLEAEHTLKQVCHIEFSPFDFRIILSNFLGWLHLTIKDEVPALLSSYGLVLSIFGSLFFTPAIDL